MEQTSTEVLGSLEEATQRTAKLIEIDAALAAEQAEEILKAVPNHPPAVLLLAVARRRSGNASAALELLERLLQAQPKWGAAHFEYGVTLAELGQGDEAMQALLTAVKLDPEHPEAWRILADHLMATGDNAAGDVAYARHVQCSTRHPTLQKAAIAMVRNDVPNAERLLKKHLLQVPTDVPAIRMLAEVAMRCGRESDAENLLLRCLELAPSFNAARYNYAALLHRRNDSAKALAEIERLLQVDSRNPSYRNLCAVILGRVGEYERSIKIYSDLLEEYPNNAKVWLSFGHVLKTEGLLADSIDAYRRSIALKPDFGEAYWSLANLKTFRFSEADLWEMESRLSVPELADNDRLHFHFALGKAFEDNADYAWSFEHYAAGNEIYRASSGYNPELNSIRVSRLKQNFNRAFFAERAGMGCDAPDPIFIVGMPRAGSTLLEQILSSHSAVEGTMELPDIMSMAKELSEQADAEDVASYAAVLASKSGDELRELGEQYIARTRIHRKTDRPYFIDKLPNNFLHIGMIHIVLPNAKIIDARRHPLACCFSNFKQHYALGQGFTYSLDDIGRFYREYVELMAHFDAVLPGVVHRVLYENTVKDTENVVRKLLDYCGLAFEPECLRFFENKRAVRTASSEQVRQPIYQDGVGHWRHYEEWLGPLKAALGPVLDAYPEPPATRAAE